MRLSMNADTTMTDLDELVASVRKTAEHGFPSFWLPQIFGLDALTALAVAGREVPEIELGTAVVPVQPRHPQMLAQQALTTNAATGGRLVLGIGLSHEIVVEGMWGLSYAKPYSYLREYLEALMPLLRGEAVQVDGEQVTCRASVDVAAEPPSVLVAALGPRMLELAGRHTDGTITWCTGPKTLAAHVIPAIREAANAAGRPEPRIVAALPVCLTDQPDGAKAKAAKVFAVYGELPSYRAMLDREGVEGPGDIALLGGEDEVGESLRHLASIGVTDFAAALAPTSREEAERTIDFLRSSGPEIAA